MTHNGKQIRVIYLELPKTVYGISLEDAKGYDVCINSTCSGIVQRHALGHELAHIFLNHLANAPTPDQLPTANRHNAIELEANRNAWKYYRLFKACSN